MKKKLRKIVILGPTQVGKSTLFNSLVKESGVKHFSYPASEIFIPYNEVKVGLQKYLLYDLPAITSLIPTNEEEKTVLKFLLKEDVEKIILVLEENSIKNNLLLFMQLAEIKIPFVTVIYKKTDIQEGKREVNFQKIEAFFNTKIVQTTPLLNIGIFKLKKALKQSVRPRWVGNYSQEVEEIILNLESFLSKHIVCAVSKRFVALGLILNCREIRNFVRENVSEKQWFRILHGLKKGSTSNNPFFIANRISDFQNEIADQIFEGKTTAEQTIQLNNSWLAVLPGANIILLLCGLFTWYYLVVNVGNRWLVKFLYNDLVGKYLEPALTGIFSNIENEFFKELFIGKYGILTIWFAYSFAIILPTIFVFFLILSFLNESGLFARLTILCNVWLRKIGLNGHSMSVLVLSSSCKVISFLKTRLLNSRQEKKIMILVSLLIIPCISQLGIISLTVSLLPFPLILLFFLVLLLQLLVIMLIFSKKKESTGFAVSIQPIILPKTKKVLVKTWNYIRWYLWETTPLLLIGNLILFALYYTKLLEPLENLFTVPIVQGLMLPKSIINLVVLGFFRKDLGAIFLYDLVNTGELTTIQLFVSLLLVTVSIPCIGVTFVLIKRRGLFYGVKITMYSLLYAYSLAYFFNWFLRL